MATTGPTFKKEHRDDMIIIGERINATRTSIARAIEERDEEHIRHEIRIQDEAGAHWIDLNAGTGQGDRDQESTDLHWLIDLALGTTEKGLCLDASDPQVLCRAVHHLDGRRPAILNSVNGEPERLDTVIPLAVSSRCPVIALAMDSEGIPRDVERRMEIAQAIGTRAFEAGIPEEDLWFDPLALPLSADVSQALVTFETLRAIRRDFPGAHTTLGLSNVSHGLPRRRLVNEAFLIAALSHGLDSAICDPTRAGVRQAITLGTLIAGGDRLCRRYTRRVRTGELV